MKQLSLLSQGQAGRADRELRVVLQMDAEGFGYRSNTYAYENECHKKISLEPNRPGVTKLAVNPMGTI